MNFAGLTRYCLVHCLLLFMGFWRASSIDKQQKFAVILLILMKVNLLSTAIKTLCQSFACFPGHSQVLFKSKSDQHDHITLAKVATTVVYPQLTGLYYCVNEMYRQSTNLSQGLWWYVCNKNNDCGAYLNRDRQVNCDMCRAQIESFERGLEWKALTQACFLNM